MQHSIVNYKAVKENSDFRIDAEYYRRYFFNLLNKITSNNYFVLYEISSNKTKRFKGDSDFDYLEISNISTADASCTYKKINKEDTPSRAQKILKSKDVIISTVRPNRNAVSIIDEIDGLKVASSGFCVLRNFKYVLPEYIFILFKTYIFRDLLDRETKATMYPAVSEDDILKLQIPILTIDLQNKIQKFVKQIFAKQNHSKSLYSQAEQLLLSELGLTDWKPKHELAFVKNFSDTQEAERFDAEYFQPMYEEIIDAVTSTYDYSKLDNLVDIKKCVEPGSEAYQNNGIMFLRVSNLSKFGFKNGNQKYISENLYRKINKHQPNQGEILLSKDATPGIAYYLNDIPNRMIPSSGILRLKVKDDVDIYPEYLTLVLNSIIVKKQYERDVGGSIINHWLLSQVKNALIPIIPINKQKKIADTVNESFYNRDISKKLLNIAKRGVELAIEKDEKTAEKWIDEELKKLEIEL